MSIVGKMRRALRGEVNAPTIALELLRRSRARVRQRRERARLDQLDSRPLCLRAEFARLSTPELLSHFQERSMPKFLAGLDAMSQDRTAHYQRELFPGETAQLLTDAARIADEHRWAVLGYGEQQFGVEINWRRDPVSGQEWPLDYHCDVRLVRGDGSDARVLWELNRLAHLLTLGRAYTLTQEERFATEVFAQLESWRAQNPTARGANWACAMEVALRAMNLLAVFEMFRRAPQMTEARLLAFLKMFETHGTHIRRHLEFSYISTSNHYLSDIVGLLWLGLMLPELEAAREWRAFALREFFGEMEKQVLADGADFEASTGYHRLALELFLYSFLLCRAGGIEIEEKYWRRLRAMLEYVLAYLRPDGRAPLVGDSDSGQVLPIRRRGGDDHAYVLALGAVVFKEPRFKLQSREMPEEVLWLLGEEGARGYEKLVATGEPARSQGFAEAGTYVMREGDLYMLLNASGCGINGRGSHGHNDALSLEVSACGSSFIVDPGTYVYTSNLRERHLFRSTAYHSTLEIDETEQNSTSLETPFVIGDEAHPRVLRWDANDERDLLVAEHDGYRRLASPVTHRRAVLFDKRGRYWIIQDTLAGEGTHDFRFRFHFAEALEMRTLAPAIAVARDKITGARLLVAALDCEAAPEFEPRFRSRDYGERNASLAACWTISKSAASRFRWAVVPVCQNASDEQALGLIARLRATLPDIEDESSL